MKLATYSVNGPDQLGIVTEGGIVDVCRHLKSAPTSLLELVARWGGFRDELEALRARSADYPLKDVTLQAPIRRPGKIFAIGLNYADHIAESGLPTPTDQIWFTKSVTSIAGPQDPIELPAVSTALDYECELVAVIGRRCRNVPRASAKEIIFGYCVGNDVSVRDWQLRTTQWCLGKSFDTHAPIGPWITTADEVSATNLDIVCAVNEEVRQQSNTRHLVFDLHAQIEHLSQAMTLEPGDLLFTGTPGGVGAASKPPRWLKEGDIVRSEIRGLGALSNRVTRGSSAYVVG